MENLENMETEKDKKEIKMYLLIYKNDPDNPNEKTVEEYTNLIEADLQYQFHKNQYHEPVLYTVVDTKRENEEN